MWSSSWRSTCSFFSSLGSSCVSFAFTPSRLCRKLFKLGVDVGGGVYAEEGFAAPYREGPPILKGELGTAIASPGYGMKVGRI